ncbi:hypothetical protein KY290_005129 [Solanum tuberosum]|uniref:Uncharacterized protein n=1 Tax=Solanum tuberosum TaxID=4113 RepID=A0ABQ7WD81_SOLTU|nr:hypothetical protein KY284_024795 [Solanum tuberosum]KAH0722477.1 hypothetical protein KY289_005521 [Solanum tuberosum]KAH0778702.1 hypothetical protein KY290_005129 [Solanum tuberosum]
MREGDTEENNSRALATPSTQFRCLGKIHLFPSLDFAKDGLSVRKEGSLCKEGKASVQVEKGGGQDMGTRRLQASNRNRFKQPILYPFHRTFSSPSLLSLPAELVGVPLPRSSVIPFPLEPVPLALVSIGRSHFCLLRRLFLIEDSRILVFVFLVMDLEEGLENVVRCLGSVSDQGVVTHITGGNFAQSSITIK